MENQEIQVNPVAEEVKNRPVNNKGKSYVIVREDHEIQGTSTEKKLPPQAIIPAKGYPPGYRFMPTDEELILEYLQKKIRNEPIPIDEISDVYLKENNPKALTETYPQLGENEWYFFTPRDRKYPNGSRPNRAADTGYWKATGADRPVRFEDKIIGFRKALVYYEGKPPKGQKTSWIMHEYRVDQPPRNKRNAHDMRLDDWVLCRIYEKASRPNKRINRRSGKDMSGDPLDDENPSHAVNTDEDDEIENPAAEARVLNDDEKVRINIAPAVVVDNNNENNLAPFVMPAAENVAMGHAHSSDEVLNTSTYGDWLQPSLQNLLINNSAVPPPHHSFMEEPPALINNGELHLHQPILDNYGMLNQQNVFGTIFLNDEQEQLALGGDFQEGSWGTPNNGTSHQVPASYFGPSSTNNTTFSDSFVTTVEDSFNSPDYNQLMPIEEKKTLKRFRY